MDLTNEIIELELPQHTDSLEIKDEAGIKEEIENIGKENPIDQSSDNAEVFLQNKKICDENKLVQMPLKKNTKEDRNLMESDGEFDAFSDNHSIYRKYNLRDKRKPVVLQEEEKEDLTGKVKKPKLKKLSKGMTEDYEYATENDNVCPHCFIHYKSNKGLSIHMRSHKCITTFICSQCSAKFDSNNELVNHKTEHKENTSHICKICKLEFSDHCDYLIHEVSHKNTSKYQCNECETVCTTKTGMKIHITTHFDRKLKCHICSKLIQAYTLVNHIKCHFKHIECGECGKICKNKQTLDYHMTVHTGVKLFQCLYCGIGFANTSQRIIHTRIHTGDRPYECTTCHRRFKQQTDMNRHILRAHEPTIHECKVCHKKFTDLNYLKVVHMRRHTHMPYECKECGKRYPNRRGLEMHTVFKHTTKKNFICKPCNVSFFLGADYKRHCKAIRHKNNMYKETMTEK